MDYGSLLQLAKKNSDNKKEVTRSLPNLAPPRTIEELRKQESEKKKILDANVAKFLAKRKNEELKKRSEADKKREELLAIRNQDSKARRRVKVMNKSAKSADKSAIEDAVGPSDYYIIEEPLCFMSEEALAQEEKFLEKLYKGPREDMFAKGKKNTNKDLSGTKDRVKLALLQGDTFGKEKVKDTKDKSKDRRKEEVNFKEEQEVKVEPKQKSQRPGPPMNYQELLKLAEKLQQEPQLKEAPKDRENDDMKRPMTAKQRAEFLCEEASRKRKEAGWREEERLKKLGKLPPVRIPKLNAPSSSVVKEEKSSVALPRIPKNGQTQRSNPESHEKSAVTGQKIQNSSILKQQAPLSQQKSTKPSLKSSSKPEGSASQIKAVSSVSTERNNQSSSKSILQSSLSKNKHPINSNMKAMPKQNGQETTKLSQFNPKGSKTKCISSADGKSRQTYLEENRSKKMSTTNGNLKQMPSKQSLPEKSRQYPPTDVKPRQFPPTDVKPRQFPPSDIKKNKIAPSDVKSRQFPPSDVKSKQSTSTDVKPKPNLPGDARLRQNPHESVKSRQFPPSDFKPRQFLPSDVKPRQFPPSDVKPRQFPPSDVKTRQFPPEDVRRKAKPPPKRRMVIESDEEYDSEVADFIDDGPEESGEDYSKYIKEIFGYDKNRYRGMDTEDDRCMESSFQQQLKEEFTSTKLGIMEDLEDIRKEKKREAMLKKRKKMKL